MHFTTSPNHGTRACSNTNFIANPIGPTFTLLLLQSRVPSPITNPLRYKFGRQKDKVDVYLDSTLKQNMISRQHATLKYASLVSSATTAVVFDAYATAVVSATVSAAVSAAVSDGLSATAAAADRSRLLTNLAPIHRLDHRGSWRLSDLKSVNGVFVNDFKIDSIVLKDGDVLVFGGGNGVI
jgi:hypothetical protein